MAKLGHTKAPVPPMSGNPESNSIPSLTYPAAWRMRMARIFDAAISPRTLSSSTHT